MTVTAKSNGNVVHASACMFLMTTDAEVRTKEVPLRIEFGIKEDMGRVMIRRVLMTKTASVVGY